MGRWVLCLYYIYIYTCVWCSSSSSSSNIIIKVTLTLVIVLGVCSMRMSCVVWIVYKDNKCMCVNAISVELGLVWFWFCFHASHPTIKHMFSFSPSWSHSPSLSLSPSRLPLISQFLHLNQPPKIQIFIKEKLEYHPSFFLQQKSQALVGRFGGSKN